MKARIVILPDGNVSVFVDEGTLETGRDAIERLFVKLSASGIKFDAVSAVEQHKHAEAEEKEHRHVHQTN